MTGPPDAATIQYRRDEEDDYEDEDDDEVFETMDDAPMKIEPHLFLGSFMAEQNAEALKRAGVTHILQVADGLQPSHPEDFKYKQVLVQDMPSEDLVAHFTKCFEFIEDAAKANGGVLVHCAAGVSRSATVCIGYIMWKHAVGYDEAFRRVHAVRPWIMPNSGFKKQLQEFERIGYDLSKWHAWRHTWAEDDTFVVHLSQRPGSARNSLGSLAESL